MTIYECLQGTDIPCAYSHFKTDQTPPYIVYIGSGKDNLDADNTHYWRRNAYQVEYYFTEKDEEAEADIEDALLAGGFIYDKSEDVYLEDQGVFVIYYQV